MILEGEDAIRFHDYMARKEATESEKEFARKVMEVVKEMNKPKSRFNPPV